MGKKKFVNKLLCGFLAILLCFPVGISTAFAAEQAGKGENLLGKNEQLESTNLYRLPIENRNIAAGAVNIFGNMSYQGWAALTGSSSTTIGTTLVGSAAFPYLAGAVLVAGTAYVLYENNENFQQLVNDSISNIAYILKEDTSLAKGFQNLFQTSIDSGSLSYQLTEEQANWAINRVADTGYLLENLTLDVDYSQYNFLRSTATKSFILQDTNKDYRSLVAYDYKSGNYYFTNHIDLSPYYEYSGYTSIFNLVDENGHSISVPGSYVLYTWYVYQGHPKNDVFDSINTARDVIEFININSPYQLSFLPQSSTDTLETLNEKKDANRITSQQTFEQTNPELTMDVPLDSVTATLNNRVLILNKDGELIYQDTNETVPVGSYPNIQWGYDSSLATSRSEFVIDGLVLDVDEDTGNLVNRKTGEKVVKDGVTTVEWDKTMTESLESITEKEDIDKKDLYTLKDLYMDEYLNRGHTIERHINKSREYLEGRLSSGLPVATTFNNALDSLIAINIAIKKKIGNDDEIDVNLSPYNFGWGIIRNGMEFDNLSDAKVVFKLNTRNYSRSYFVLTSYPTIK